MDNPMIKDSGERTRFDTGAVRDMHTGKGRFVQRALESVRPGGKVAMFLKVQFLEGQKRGAFFKDTPPRTVYISRSRLACYKNGDMSAKPESAIAYAWYVWEKGFTGDPVIKWFN